MTVPAQQSVARAILVVKIFLVLVLLVFSSITFIFI